ncbi:MAG TPA: extracellular solute-binding protein [Pilimelia sp.]|nr:extracellular solute-binding protein [Pilimelia sp.]
MRGVLAGNWELVAQWVSAVATVVALIFAAVAAVAAQRVYGVESKRDQLNAQDRAQQALALKRAQGALVSAWWNLRAGGEPAHQWGVYLRNASETPVYRATLSVVDLHNSNTTVALEVPVIPPGETTFHPVSLPTGPGHAAPAPAPVDSDAQHAADFRVEMSFTDSAGVRWFRDQHGKLSELGDEVMVFCDESRAGALTDFAADFLRRNGVSVGFTVQDFPVLREAFIESATKGDAGEVLICPHDWIPELVQLGLLEPITISERRLSQFQDRALRAVTVDGQVYGVPYSLETVALIRNTALAPRAPATIEELADIGEALCARGAAARPLGIWVGAAGNPFNLQPVYSSAGGELFGALPDGSANPADIRVATDESIRAFGRLHALGERGRGLLTCEYTDDTETIELFGQGAVPFLIAPARMLGDLRGADIPHEVQPVPPLAGGRRPMPFVAVNAFVVSTRGDNKIIAHDMINDYLTREKVVMALYAAQPRPLVLRELADSVRAGDPRVSVFHDECVRGELVPMLPQMARVWRLLGQAQADVIRGDSPAATARRLHQELARL